MAKTASHPRECSVARTLQVVGEKWALLVLREAFLGTRHFEEMVQSIGAPRDTLAARLRTLVAAGILERRRYSEHPPRDEYLLTEAGRDLYPVIAALRQWGDRYLAGPEGPPMRFEHRCGGAVEVRAFCPACGEDVAPDEVRRLVAGPEPVAPGSP